MMTLRPDFVLAADIGGTNSRFGLINDQGELVNTLTTYPVPFDPNGAANPDLLIDQIEFHLAEAKKTTGVEVPFGLSLCGNVIPETGEAVLVANLHWQNVPFGRMIAERCQVPVYSATDVRQAALAEAVWGAARGRDNFLWGTVGTGYGGYLFLNGRLYGGAHGFAGNFGHTPLDETEGYLCGCGQRGCVETFVSGPAIARAGQLAVDKKNSAILESMAGGEPVTTRHVFAAYEAGDPGAHRILDRVIRLICQNLGAAVNLLDLEMIVMGGGVVNGAPWFIERIDKEIRNFLMTVEARRDLKIVRETFPNSALWGAAAHAFAETGILDSGLLER